MTDGLVKEKMAFGGGGGFQWNIFHKNYHRKWTGIEAITLALLHAQSTSITAEFLPGNIEGKMLNQDSMRQGPNSKWEYRDVCQIC
jgi:hypothetical protein